MRKVVVAFFLLSFVYCVATETARVNIVFPGGMWTLDGRGRLFFDFSYTDENISFMAGPLSIQGKGNTYIDIPVGEVKITYCFLPYREYDRSMSREDIIEKSRNRIASLGQPVMLERLVVYKGTLNPGAVLYLSPPEFIVNNALKDEKWYNKHVSKTPYVELTILKDNPQLAQTQGQQTPTTPQKKENIVSDVDQNIPASKNVADDTYVLIIANEDYEFLDKVAYAKHDGQIFKEYCIKTLGIPERQVFYYPDATFGKLADGVGKLTYCLNNFEGSRAIVYYCGHGIPDEKTNEAYIIPVDGKGTNTETCYSLNRFYKTLAATKAASITYFMDACFTGANKDGNMLVAARGVAREAKKETISGNAVVFSASSGDETAMTYADKGHGLFTYYLLKKLQETEGNVTYEELAGYISKNVKKDAFFLNEKPQNPVVATSPAAASTWKNMKLK